MRRSENIFADIGLADADILQAMLRGLYDAHGETFPPVCGDMMRTFSAYLATLPEEERAKLSDERLRDELIESLYLLSTEAQKEAILDAVIHIFSAETDSRSA